MVIQVHQDIGDTGYIQIQIISRDLDDTGIIGATVGQIHWDSDLDDAHHWDSRVIIEGTFLDGRILQIRILHIIRGRIPPGIYFG